MLIDINNTLRRDDSLTFKMLNVRVHMIHLQLTFTGLNIILTGSESEQAFME